MSHPTSHPGASRAALLLGVAALTLAADQGTKAWALHALGDGQPRQLIGSLLSLRLIANPGAAFSMAAGQTWIITLVAVAVGVFVATQVRRIRNTWWALGIGLILGGLLGNLGDRLFRPPSFGQGHVVDFIDYAGFFIGNVADIAIVGAAGLMVLLSARGVPYDDAQPAADGSADGSSHGSRDDGEDVSART